MLFMLGFMAVMLNMDPNGPPAVVWAIILPVFTIIMALHLIPSALAGYGLLKQRRWAKTAAIVAAVMSASNVPFGTAVCVYSFWFLFSEPGKTFFEQQKYALPPRRQEWLPNVQNQPTQAYVPPKTPPDWR